MMGAWRSRSDAGVALRQELDALRARCERLEEDAERDRRVVEQARLQARAASRSAELQAEELRTALAALFERLEQVRRSRPAGDQPPAGGAR